MRETDGDASRAATAVISNDTSHEHVDWRTVRPPHEARDFGHVEDITSTLRFAGHLPPLVLWGDRLLTGSHRYEAFTRRNMPVCVIRLPNGAARGLAAAGFTPKDLEFPDVYEVMVASGFAEWPDSFTEGLDLMDAYGWVDLANGAPYEDVAGE